MTVNIFEKLPSLGSQERQEAFEAFERQMSLANPFAILQTMPGVDKATTGVFESAAYVNFQVFLHMGPLATGSFACLLIE